jgi:hypothetical protein
LKNAREGSGTILLNDAQSAPENQETISGQSAAHPYTFKLSPRGLEILAFVAAFCIGAVLRAIPQMQFPYAIGFDSPIYMYFAKTHSANPTLVRPFEDALGLAYLAGFNMMNVMQVVPPILYGFFGTAGYTFAKRVLKWGDGLSLIAALNLCLSVAALRISWDMFDLLFGLTLLLYSISYLEKFRTMKWRGKALFVILSGVTLVSHQLVAVLFLGTLLFWAVLSEESKDKRFYWFALVLSLVGFAAFWLAGGGGASAAQYESSYSFSWVTTIFTTKPFSANWTTVNQTVLFPAYLFLLIIPVAVIGFMTQRSLLTITSLSLLGSLASLLTPSFLLGGILEWRWVVLLGVPVSFYTVNGFRRILRGRYLPLMVILVLLINVSSYAFVGLTSYPTYYTAGGIMPNNMVGASLPIYNIPQTITLLDSIPNQSNSTIIVNGNWVGWARFYTHANVVTFSGAYPEYNSLAGAVANQSSLNNLYLLWWEVPQAESLGFHPIATDGGLILFKYNSSAVGA